MRRISECRGHDLHNPRKDCSIALNKHRTPGVQVVEGHVRSAIAQCIDGLLMVDYHDNCAETIHEINDISVTR